LNTFEDSVKSAYLSFPSASTGNIVFFTFTASTMFFKNNRILQFLMLLLIKLVAFLQNLYRMALAIRYYIRRFDKLSPG